MRIPLNCCLRNQKDIVRFVKACFSAHHGNNNVEVTARDIDKAIGQLNKSSSPGLDGITAECLAHGRS